MIIIVMIASLSSSRSWSIGHHGPDCRLLGTPLGEFSLFFIEGKILHCEFKTRCHAEALARKGNLPGLCFACFSHHSHSTVNAKCGFLRVLEDSSFIENSPSPNLGSLSIQYHFLCSVWPMSNLRMWLHSSSWKCPSKCFTCCFYNNAYHCKVSSSVDLSNY